MDTWLRNNPISFVLLLVFVVFVGYVFHHIQPKSYEECLFTKGKNTEGRDAAYFVIQYCAQKFPDNPSSFNSKGMFDDLLPKKTN